MDAEGEITSLSDFIERLGDGGLGLGEPPVWYRGVSDLDFALIPSVFRSPREGDNEQLMIKRFMQDAQPLLADRPTQWDWLFIAQHHGVPTRVLDWSESPLIGLFFATGAVADDADDTERPGGFWVLNPQALNTFALGTPSQDLPMFGLDEQLDVYAPLAAIPAMAHLPPAAGLAVRSFLRISAQWGTFTIHPNEKALEDIEVPNPVLRKFSVNEDAKASIRDELKTIGFDDRTVFPDLHHLGLSIGKRF